MKFFDKLNLKRSRSASRKHAGRSISRSDPASFSSGSESSSSSSDASCLKARCPGASTPTTVLPPVGTSADCSRDAVELVEVFRAIDRDGDGKITRQELAALLRRVGPDPPGEEEARAMVGELDRDGDGCIDLDELGAIGSVFGPARGPELQETFELFDKDGDGRITAEELLEVFVAIGDDACTLADCRRMIAGVNGTGGGFVCFDDFARMMEPQ